MCIQNLLGSAMIVFSRQMKEEKISSPEGKKKKNQSRGKI